MQKNKKAHVARWRHNVDWHNVFGAIFSASF